MLLKPPKIGSSGGPGGNFWRLRARSTNIRTPSVATDAEAISSTEPLEKARATVIVVGREEYREAFDPYIWESLGGSSRDKKFEYAIQIFYVQLSFLTHSLGAWLTRIHSSVCNVDP